ncbi:MAG: hypothetical protein HOG49_24085 [Candidatus Scalindua sp.]|nr:hypothetical protein [Candidatus Scalindua sp.]
MSIFRPQLFFINQHYYKLINAIEVEDPEIPVTAVKFYRQEEAIDHYRKVLKGDTREKRIDCVPG